MHEKPRRRWFRFRLSTIFVLVAIAAWTMSLRPFFTEELVLYYRQVLPVDPGKPKALGPEVRAVHGKPPKFILGSAYESRCQWERTLAPAMKYPATLLAAFLVWKACWLVIERRRNWPATHC